MIVTTAIFEILKDYAEAPLRPYQVSIMKHFAKIN